MKKRVISILLALLCTFAMVFTSCEAEQGDKGDQGEQGIQGEEGRGIARVGIINGELKIIYTDGTTEYIRVVTKAEGTDGLEYYPLPDGSYGIMMGTTKYPEEIIIPAEYCGKAVTHILDNAFSGAGNLKKITIPKGVTSIGDSAFSGCSSLESITIPEGVTSISGSAFDGCSSLESITIPESVTSIGYFAFFGCSSLTTIYFTGTEDEWGSIDKHEAYMPSDANIVYNYVPE